MSYFFLDAVFKAFISVFAVESNNSLLYLLDRFLLNDKNPYPLTYYLVLLSLKYNTSSVFIIDQCQINFVFYF